MKKVFTINYFGEKAVSYWGTLAGAKQYADDFSANLALTYNGDLVISDDAGDICKQTWAKGKLTADWHFIH